MSADTIIQANTFAFKDSAGNGLKFDSVAPTAGQVLYVDSLTGSVGNVKTGYIIKQWTGSVIATDPVNTLYYSF
jgi:hypothetical protein